MACKGLILALAVLVLIPIGARADEQRTPPAVPKPVLRRLPPTETSRSPGGPPRDAAYGFSDSGPQSVKSEPIDLSSDAADRGTRHAKYGTGDVDPGAIRFASFDDLSDLDSQEPQEVEVSDESVAEQDGSTIDSAAPLYTVGQFYPYRGTAARLGYWIVDARGSPTKVGEYQGLESSLFWDVDRLSSDGVRSLDLIATGLDDESTVVDLSFFGPMLSADFEFQRYPHRLDHVPLTNMPTLTPTDQIVAEDLNAGEDYAIRVQEIKTAFKGNFSENTKVRVNVNVLRKFGGRQANTMQHCANSADGINTACHVTSRRQRIDWLTVKVEPVVETRIGPIRAEYSRPMRVFSQSDQLITANYGDFFTYGWGEEAYAVVPDGYSQADRLKLGVDLGAATTFYVNTQVRDTENRLRETHRKSYGFDARLTNRSWDCVKLTAYAALNDQTNQNLPFFLSEEQTALGIDTVLIPPYGIRHPINYFRTRLGADASWYPFRRGGTLRGLGVTVGAEFGRIERSYATYVIQIPEEPPGPVVDEESTNYVSGHIDTSMRWSPCLETFLRCKIRSTKDPLFGVNRYTGSTNTSLPNQEDLIEVGGTWMPSTKFLASATVGLANTSNDSDITFFEENNYPMTFTAWYQPTPCWSLSAGYGYYSNWIDQDISFPSDDPLNQTGDVRRWNYGGRGQVVNFGSDYAWSEKLVLVGEVEFVHSIDAFDPFEPWPDLPAYSDVVVDRTRVTAGIDWLMSGRISTYFRYVFEDYDDKSASYNTGSAQMFLAGFSGAY